MPRLASPTKASRATVSKAATRRGSVTRLGRIWLSTMLRRAAAKSVISRSIPRCCGPLAFSASVYKRPGARKQRASAAGSHLVFCVDRGQAAHGFADEGFARHGLEGRDEARVRHPVVADLALHHVETCCCEVGHLEKHPALLRPVGLFGLGL